ncbi:MAG: L,D-transpeptidase family protein [Burkholderiaceae bacterium]|nr:L,D-transpeptidase family protein [Burkholderiaceae bacterium]
MRCRALSRRAHAGGEGLRRRGLLQWGLRAAGLGLWPGLAAAAPSRWLDRDGRPGALALQAIELLADAASHGLVADDYGVAGLQAALRRAAAAPEAADCPAQALAPALDAAMKRFLADLHAGRVDPAQLQLRFTPARREPFDAAGLLQAALASGRLADAVNAAAPALPQYQALRDALAVYRKLADHPAWQQALPPLPGDPGSSRRPARLSPGQDYAGASLLAWRLALLGDLPSAAWPRGDSLRYAGVLVDALRAFQQRHGLDSDGVIGTATLAALQVPPAARARQIELALERLRWTPLLQAPRMIVINIPEFVLRAYEVVDGRIELRQQMKVIVGKALDTRTPLFDEDLRFIEFSPYWNVPPSIARSETVPRLRRDPGYFDREGFEFVAADGSVLTGLSDARLDAVIAGRLRIRQRPGPRNALGDIKFVFPNREHIFLHHTPATALFERQRRDFSHGCIRVEQPVALAGFVLRDQPGWGEPRIREAMGQGRSTTLRLDAPLPVLIAYGTTLVKGGRIHFLDDIYGQDRVLDAALRQPRPALPAAD